MRGNPVTERFGAPHCVADVVDVAPRRVRAAPEENGPLVGPDDRGSALIQDTSRNRLVSI